MKCPVCGAAELVHDTRDLPYIYKGEQASIPAVTGDYCPACGEVVLDREHGDRYSELIGLFQRQVNATYVDPSYIAKVRRSSLLISARPQSFSVAGSTPFPVTKMARQGRLWRSSNC